MWKTNEKDSCPIFIYVLYRGGKKLLLLFCGESVKRSCKWAKTKRSEQKAKTNERTEINDHKLILVFFVIYTHIWNYMYKLSLSISRKRVVLYRLNKTAITNNIIFETTDFVKKFFCFLFPRRFPIAQEIRYDHHLCNQKFNFCCCYFFFIPLHYSLLMLLLLYRSYSVSDRFSSSSN